MKNIPRIYIADELEIGKTIPLSKELAHYLTRVMRTDECIVFGGGLEFTAKITNYQLSIINSTNRPDPSNNMTLAFAPIKQARLEEMINMATQLGVAKLQPVLTEHTAAKHINWNRIEKIMAEAAEQSNRNSVPELLPPISFSDFVSENPNIVFADERFAHQDIKQESLGQVPGAGHVLIGPEGGFSDAEFAALDKAGARGISLGGTVLRAELAAAIAIKTAA